MRFTSGQFLVLMVFCIFVSTSTLIGQTGYDPNEGSLAALKPRIPEPMVFDLVRPLGAERGELELNSLFEHPLHTHERMSWAPEAEIAIVDGLGVEFELPFEGRRLDELKFAVQGTLGLLGNRRNVIHGWQTIARVDRADQYINADLLHLTGIQLTGKWSTLLMNGARRETDGQRRGFALVSNASLFYSQGRHVVFGVESNLKRGGPLSDSWLLMPQAHFRVVDSVNLQVGAGVTSRSAHATRGVVGWRLIREF